MDYFGSRIENRLNTVWEDGGVSVLIFVYGLVDISLVERINEWFYLEILVKLRYVIRLLGVMFEYSGIRIKLIYNLYSRSLGIRVLCILFRGVDIYR